MFFQMRINLSKNRCLGYFAACAVAFPVWQHSVVAEQTGTWKNGYQRPSNATLVMARNAFLQPKFVPLGTHSLVDQYRNDQRQRNIRTSAKPIQYQEFQSREHYLVRLPQSGFAAPPLPTTGAAPVAPPGNGGMGFPSQILTPSSPGFQEPNAPAPLGLPPSIVGPLTRSNPITPPTTMAAPKVLPPALPMNPAISDSVPVVGLPSQARISRNADMLPIARPQLNDGFATVGNSCLVSEPSSYNAAMGLGNCSGGSFQTATNQGYIATEPQVASPPKVASTAPSGLVPITRPSAPGVPKKPLINLGQDKNAVVVGQGIIGQPVAYVPGQCIRNWIRYISP